MRDSARPQPWLAASREGRSEAWTRQSVQRRPVAPGLEETREGTGAGGGTGRHAGDGRGTFKLTIAPDVAFDVINGIQCVSILNISMQMKALSLLLSAGEIPSP